MKKIYLLPVLSLSYLILTYSCFSNDSSRELQSFTTNNNNNNENLHNSKIVSEQDSAIRFYNIPYGKWEVFKYIPDGGPAAFTDEDAKRYINKEIILEKNRAVIFNDACNTPIYEIGKVKLSEYLYDNNQPNTLEGVTIDTVMTINVTCKENPVYKNIDSLNFNFSMILTDKNTMVVDVNGVCFYLQKEI